MSRLGTTEFREFDALRGRRSNNARQRGSFKQHPRLGVNTSFKKSLLFADQLTDFHKGVRFQRLKASKETSRLCITRAEVLRRHCLEPAPILSEPQWLRLPYRRAEQSRRIRPSVIFPDAPLEVRQECLRAPVAETRLACVGAERAEGRNGRKDGLAGLWGAAARA
jgi:hypothetical protein